MRVACKLTMSLGSNLLSTAGILAVLLNGFWLLDWIREAMKKVDGMKSLEDDVEAMEENLRLRASIRSLIFCLLATFPIELFYAE